MCACVSVCVYEILDISWGQGRTNKHHSLSCVKLVDRVCKHLLRTFTFTPCKIGHRYDIVSDQVTLKWPLFVYVCVCVAEPAWKEERFLLDFVAFIFFVIETKLFSLSDRLSREEKIRIPMWNPTILLIPIFNSLYSSLLSLLRHKCNKGAVFFCPLTHTVKIHIINCPHAKTEHSIWM